MTRHGGRIQARFDDRVASDLEPPHVLHHPQPAASPVSAPDSLNGIVAWRERRREVGWRIGHSGPPYG